VDARVGSWGGWHSVEKHGEDGVWNLPLGREPKEEETLRGLLLHGCLLDFYRSSKCKI